MNRKANRLLTETSPYLLQHAYNPVNWYPWGEEALEKARTENKLILVSIGYSACHWCHVMEHESFEDEQVAEIMNRSFVCIKIDREERPDIDQIYMYAVQLITGSGGWPLNCFCLPDQRPIYGGTYFRKEDWKNLLLNLDEYWKQKPEEAIEYAVRLTDGIKQSEQIKFVEEKISYTEQSLTDIFEPWKRQFDLTEGGYNRAPKFPLPNNWQFMLRYAHLMKDNAAQVIAGITLEKMAFGGIYDHIGGGFSRYSVDERWHVPHFEKMLYDNAQLVSLYAEGYLLFEDQLYKNVIFETLEWVKREMTSAEGGFYSALDADSEGVEGKFYTYTKEELKTILGEEEALFSIYFNVTDDGNWHEEHTNIFFRKQEDNAIAAALGITVEKLHTEISQSKVKVLAHRNTRIRPSLDDKILASWNGMMLKAYTDAYRVFPESDFLEAALKNARFILQYMMGESGELIRSYKSSGSTGSTAFLDDYSFVIDGFISLYEVTFDEIWLTEARKLSSYAFENFYDESTGLFFYTSSKDKQLIARKHEITDNVIPSSNSVMANNLYKLGHFYDNENDIQIALQMLQNVFPQIKSYGSAYSNWANLLLNTFKGIYEVVITGPEAENKRKELEKSYIPNKIILGGVGGTLSLLKDKQGEKTRIFVCRDRTCLLPVTEITEALKQIG